VYTVFYRSEPREYCKTPYLAGFRELWEYTHDNLGYALFAGRQRFVPPGAMPNRPVSHPLRMAPLRTPMLQVGNLRRACFAVVERLLPQGPLGRVRLLNRAWSDAALDRALGTSSVWLSVHKRCNFSAQEPFESFRASQLLGAGRVMLSERSHALDEAAFAGLVVFCPSRRWRASSCASPRCRSPSARPTPSHSVPRSPCAWRRTASLSAPACTA